LLSHVPIVLKQMIGLPAFILAGCMVCAWLILTEFGSITSHRPSPGTRVPPEEIKPAAPEIRESADPLFNPTLHRPETASSVNNADLPLRDVRLTGVVIGPDLRIAIFAVAGTNSRVLSEGEVLKGWRLDRILPKGVVLSGPAGNILLEPQPDANLVRPTPPVAVQSGQPGPAMVEAPRQPTAVTPITVVNLSAGTPAQPQGYPYYLPQYNPGYDAYNSWDWGWG
jgi:hypothetical protein